MKKSESRFSTSDYAGAWSYMSDKEEAEILRSLDKLWKGWDRCRRT